MTSFTRRAALAQSLIVLIGGIVALALAYAALSQSPSSFIVVIGVFLIVAGIAFVIFGVILLVQASHAAADQWPGLYRKSQFAAANGFTFIPSEQQPDLPGIVFQIGSNPKSFTVFRGSGADAVEFGNYRFDLRRDGPSGYPLTWSYVCAARPLPAHRVILAPRGRRRSSFYDLSRLRRLPAGDPRFEVWQSRIGAVDTATLFAPAFLDLLAQQKLTVELNENRVFVYKEEWRNFSTIKAMAEVAEILDAIDTGVVTPRS
ncbi:hypothetical protein AX769_04425 [Frondihabitans sp. PAMC 28766]|uniref:hypothetical protein n=1 Tax=Frondihabitans sp. PAMC 28766 TaxID=1795630 RepID=UPI00078E3526|nr:hypothetical protein [Frondihabitans sp. PAMC 28766]AMM19522.1 hypothetical protein AX769_04425 [Frondihabitans sp. PAMC 28766]